MYVIINMQSKKDWLVVVEAGAPTTGGRGDWDDKYT